MVDIYIDTGCSQVSPSCLECPLEACKYDDPGAYHIWKKDMEYRLEVKEALARGDSVEDIALRHKLTERTIYRIKAQIKGHIGDKHARIRAEKHLRIQIDIEEIVTNLAQKHKTTKRIVYNLMKENIHNGS